MSVELPFFDTNVLLYAFKRDDPRSRIAEDLLELGGLTSVQVLNEFVAVATWKLKMPWDVVSSALDAIFELCPEPMPLTVDLHHSAVRICRMYGFHIYDSLVIAAALRSGCATLYSEDLQDGQRIGTLTIRNPFR